MNFDVITSSLQFYLLLEEVCLFFAEMLSAVLALSPTHLRVPRSDPLPAVWRCVKRAELSAIFFFNTVSQTVSHLVALICLENTRKINFHNFSLLAFSLRRC